MSNRNETTPEAQSPTTFELAQLALNIQKQLNRHPQANGIYADAVNIALGLWDEADKARVNRQKAKDHLAHVMASLFVATEKQWRELCDTYPGHKKDIPTALETTKYPREDVAKKLFRDSSLSAKQRERLFMGLPTAAVKHKLPAPPGRSWAGYEPVDRPPRSRTDADRNVQYENCTGFIDTEQGREPIILQNLEPVRLIEREMAQPMLSAKLCRWLAAVRQHQLALNKRRDYVPPRQERRPKKEHNIQFKPKYSA